MTKIASLDRRKWQIPKFLCRPADDMGQAIVELALTVPVLLVLLVGAAEFGRLAYYAVEVSNAARAGAQYGAQSSITASDFTGMVTAAQRDAANVTLTATGTTATALCACSDEPNPPTATSACSSTFSCSGSARIIEYVQVNTQATITPIFKYPGLSKTFIVSGQTILRVEQ
jgi:Flp pilus assembly protein TadG